MAKERGCKFYGYVRVDLHSQSPRRWKWSVRRDCSDVVVFSSDAPFAHAEDAWAAGQRVLTSLETGMVVDPNRLLVDAD